MFDLNKALEDMWFKNYKTFYDCKLYTKQQLHDFVKNNLFLSPEGYEKITGDKYEADQG